MILYKEHLVKYSVILLWHMYSTVYTITCLLYFARLLPSPSSCLQRRGGGGSAGRAVGPGGAGTSLCLPCQPFLPPPVQPPPPSSRACSEPVLDSDADADVELPSEKLNLARSGAVGAEEGLGGAPSAGASRSVRRDFVVFPFYGRF